MSLGLQPVERSSLSDAVFDQLSAQILAGRIGPGDPLPSERELASLLGVNRGAIREGLKRLAQAGLIEQRHGGGTFVLDYKRHGDLGLLARLLFSSEGAPDLDVARSIMEMRSALAPDVARLCAERADEDLRRQLAEVVEDMRGALADDRLSSSAELERLQLLSLELWDLLVQGSRNIAYRLAFNTLRQTYEQIRDALVIPLAEELRQVDRCAELVDAVARRDGAAARDHAAALVDLGRAGMAAALELLDQIDSPKTPTRQEADE